jgi:phosphoenolpyruvate carboxylase
MAASSRRASRRAITTKQLLNQLTGFRSEVEQDPLANPVRRLGFDISQDLELGKESLSSIGTLIDTLTEEAFQLRADHLKSYLKAPSLRSTLNKTNKPFKSFSAFQTHWQQRRNNIVFTGHPTFLMPEETGKALANSVSANSVSASAATDKRTSSGTSKDTLPSIRDGAITLADEHRAVIDCVSHAGNALNHINQEILTTARDLFPRKWKSLHPNAMGIATWVGYDMDGRTDIAWYDVIRHRLIEKQFFLHRYHNTLSHLLKRHNLNDKSLGDTANALHLAEQQASRCARAMKADFTSAEEISTAGNIITASGRGKLTKLDPLIKTLRQAAGALDDKPAQDLLLLASEMETLGLGAGAIHFRLNAAQIRNAIRQTLNLPDDADLFGRSALQAVCDLIENVKPVKVNFASLAIEQTTAARIAIAIAQIIKHIDATNPIRLLIAECETPVTILSTLYFARLFAIDQHVDVCPLLETETAMERAERIFDRLFQQKIYRKMIRRRGVLAIETGFSDAGRFMGQIPAALAIERVQVQLAQMMDRHNLGDVRAIIFDTHGESMGRGGHPSSMIDRNLYTMSPFARQKFAELGIALTHETSFQGGDGYVFFANDKIARKTLCAILASEQQAEALAKNDPFYKDVSTSLDFYYRVKHKQEELYADGAYHITIAALGLSMMPPTGSRKSRRQFEHRADEETSLRRIRAIPHNGALQQLCFLANITEGIGDAVGSDIEEFALLYKNSDRFQRIMKLAARAFSLSEIKTLIAYLRVYDGSFWGTRPLSTSTSTLDKASTELALLLAADPRYGAALQLAAKMRPSILKMSKLLDQLGLCGSEGFCVPAELDLLHAIRIALIEHLFLLAARLPNFAPMGDFSRRDVIELIFDLNIPEAVLLLREAFPTHSAQVNDFAMTEPADWPDSQTPRYAWVSRELISPMEESYRLIQRISAGISHFYSAMG